VAPTESARLRLNNKGLELELELGSRDLMTARK
jgi:hypothetical protein